jgi:hypothetical protein
MRRSVLLNFFNRTDGFILVADGRCYYCENEGY